MGSSCFPCIVLGGRKKEIPPAPAMDHDVVAFRFKNVSSATRRFRKDNLVGREAGLYRGYLVNQTGCCDKASGGVDSSRSTEQGNSREELLGHVLMLRGLRHPNIVDLVGYCADGHHRILVHEFMPLGSLQDHLHDPCRDKAARLDWNTRMKIVAGVANGLGYLHQHRVVYRGMTCSNILLGDGYHPKLSKPGMAELGRPQVDLQNARCYTRVTLGYLAPKAAMTGRLSVESDVYNFC